ncbi:MAG: hypothetical protein WCE62_17025, partial [Polyangiales bacterium]
GILTKQMYEDPVPPKVRVPQISERVERLIMRCLEKKREHRYQTMHEVEVDLQNAQGAANPSGPDIVTLAPVHRPVRERQRVSAVYLGGLGVSLLMLLGSLALDAYTERRTDLGNASPAQSSAMPKTPVRAAMLASPGESGEDRDARGNHGIANPSELGDAEVEAAPPKKVRRKPRQHVKALPAADDAILDPWN